MFGFWAACLMATAAPASFHPTDLRCESLRNPLGIDVLQPRLSWVLEADSAKARGLSQTAYQVLVASTPENLAADRGDRWDSGKVSSEASINVHYSGRTPASQAGCFWKVRVWDQDGHASAWSKPARWTMGLLNPPDWKASWIGRDEKEGRSLLTGTQWIWFPEGSPEKSAPVGTRYFRRVITLAKEQRLQRAWFRFTSDNQGTLFVNGEAVGRANDFHSANEVDVSRHLHAGENVLALSAQNVGETPNPAGLMGILEIEFAQGARLVVPTDAQWKAAERESAGWNKSGFDDSHWLAAKVLGPVGMAPWGDVNLPENRRLPARWLRKEFTVDKKVRRATVTFSGLGLSELCLNGRKVGNEVLSPALSEYPKRVFYVTHDVTSQLQRGRNAIGVILGNGRFYAPRRESPTFTKTYSFPKLLLQMRVDYADGTSRDIVSDQSWKLTTNGPIRANNEYDGEEYDARMELDGWAKPGYDDSDWQQPEIVSAPGGKLAAQMIDPIRVTGIIKPIAMTQPEPGTYIFDMGQNMVGWCRLKVSGPRGTEVSLRHAETLKPDGTLYLANIRGAKVTDLYTLKGQGPEIYEPRFTYHGFRYVELKGYPGKPSLSTIEGQVVNDDLESAGDFTCSQPMINRIYHNILWGVRGNYRSIPTDCPQRDERQGWLGDRSAESRGETYLFRNGKLYAKWVQDMADAQKDNGSVPDVCPAYWPFYNDNVTWPSSTVIIPDAMLDQFADTDLIARHYPSMVRWIDHLCGYIKNNIMPRDTYGDWCVPPEDPKLIHSKDPARKTAGPILGTTYLCHCLRLMARYAALLDKSDDVPAIPSKGRPTASRLERAILESRSRSIRQRFADLLRASLGLRHGAARPAAARVQSIAEQDSLRVQEPHRHRSRRGAVAQSCLGGQWAGGHFVHVCHQHHVSELGVHGGERRHDGLGTVERQHRRPGDELAQPRHAGG